jgi:hypothetical protein
MTDDLDIFRAAKLVIDNHREDAPIRAAQRADELPGNGDAECPGLAGDHARHRGAVAGTSVG